MKALDRDNEMYDVVGRTGPIARAITKDRAEALAHVSGCSVVLHAVERGCFCPDDCNCHYPHRFNYCGCKAHAEVAAR